MARGELDALLDAIDRAYDRRSWHGTNLRGSVRRLTAAEAAWRPRPNRHNIWEVAVHCAYWKYAVWRRLTGGRRGSFPFKGSNWFVRPAVSASDDEAWRADLALLDRMHGDLRDAVASLGAAALHRRQEGGSTTVFDLVTGIAAHDLYHAGQIQLLKALAKGDGSRFHRSRGKGDRAR
jgi:hypothetical protein